MPYRIDLPPQTDDVLDRLVALGALDVDATASGTAALLPDTVLPNTLAATLGIDHVIVSPAVGRDEGSVWNLGPRAVRAGGVLVVPEPLPAPPGALRLTDGPVFGSGLHPTTGLCLDALDTVFEAGVPAGVLDVGTGSGILALAAMRRGVPLALGVDTDPEALRAAAANARLNDMADRLRLALGGPEVVTDAWPLVFANILAAPLIEMAPVLIRRVGHRGRLVLSGISWSVAPDVTRAYTRLGMRHAGTDTREGWSALLLDAAW